MKRIFISTQVLILLLMASYGYSQDSETAADTTKYWNVGGLISMNFSQSAFSNWAAGGDNNMGLSFFYKPFFNYNKDKLSWENNFDFRYGKNKIADDPWRKSDDLLELNSKLGIASGKSWFYTGILNFRTQFDDGYATKEQINLTSRFMAPGYLSLALGMDYKPSEHFSLFLSPLTYRATFVLDEQLSENGAYGVTPGEKSLSQIGPSLILNYKKEVMENVLVDTKMNALYEYASDPKFVFIWDFILGLKVNKFITTTLTTGMIYDQNILFDVLDTGGNVIEQEKRVQFKEVLAIGVTFSY